MDVDVVKENRYVKYYLYLSPLFVFPLGFYLYDTSFMLFQLYLYTSLILVVGNMMIIKLIKLHYLNLYSKVFFSKMKKTYIFYLLIYIGIVIVAFVATALYYLSGLGGGV
ncbi:MAG: hypothetical protein ABII85_01255 [Bacillota bacterium]